MPDTAHRVAMACSAWAGPKPCNVFTRDVASHLGIILPGGRDVEADKIVEAMRHQWRRLTSRDAILAAGQGAFVVAGLPSYEFSPRSDGTKVKDGHVCVVIPGKYGHYPRVFSTNADTGPFGKSSGDHPLSGHVFSHTDAAKVQYFTPPYGASGTW
jgi:hypothetical protein